MAGCGSEHFGQRIRQPRPARVNGLGVPGEALGSLTWDETSPVLWLEGMLPSDQGAALETELTRRAERLPGDPNAADPGGARLADALVETAAGSDPEPATV